ncbi:alpha/beta hydrolase [Cohnella rhizosphaerae]|uniref:Alpha/beta hydrolase n=1 Tax=Cohnella rhizosphaerae TaxID=1457232 RepID=A0A9X4KX68_9BACL|nr:alpha/beta hydrolase [Cohnella rhizosphaerae]MDG0811996.1 alpha/beta hydrolase [Cohnella rhizosphaerae]
MTAFTPDERLLWPDGAPYAEGDGPEDRPAIFPYLLEGTDRPVVIVAPGGGYGTRAAHEGEPIAKWLNGLGISAFVLRYRVAPYKHPAPLADALRAVRTVRARAAEFGIDPGRIGLLGFSAGGHLVATAGTQWEGPNPEAADEIDRASDRPDLIVLCYPVITFKDPHTHAGSRQNLLGETPDAALVDAMSAERRVTAETPPAFLWHTSDDAAVPVENSLLFAAALREKGVPFDLHVYSKGVHGIGLAEDHPYASGWTSAAAAWLKTQGF